MYQGLHISEKWAAKHKQIQVVEEWDKLQT